MSISDAERAHLFDSEVAQLHAEAEQATRADAEDDGEQQTPQWETFYPDVEAFVRQVFAPTFVRRTTALFRWCPQWWAHPEAVVRLEALWRTWEVARVDARAGMAFWLREHADHHLPILSAAAGPFAECDPREHFDHEPPHLPTEPAPQGWWDPAAADEQDRDEAEDQADPAGQDAGATGLEADDPTSPLQQAEDEDEAEWGAGPDDLDEQSTDDPPMEA